jgi:hypothetical protein
VFNCFDTAGEGTTTEVPTLVFAEFESFIKANETGTFKYMMESCDGDDNTVPTMQEIFDLCDTSMDSKLELFEFEKCYNEACSSEIGSNPNAECTYYTAE